MDQYSRTQMILGKEAVLKLRGFSVIVFGVGGVGSYAAEALCRAGIGRIAVCDDDKVCPTNINRQLIAMHSTVGKYKAEVMKERILDINPDCEACALRIFYNKETADSINLSKYSYVIDAIDTVSSKILLIEKAAEAKVPIISCMGAGNKLDPTQFEVGDIYKTSVCPLAKVMRKELKTRGIKSLKTVYSKEPALPLRECDCESGNIRPGKHIPGSVSFVPPVAGMILAGEVIKDLLGI